MALTKVITGVTDLNQAQSTNGLKFPTGSVFAGTPEESMIRNDQSQSSETSSSTMQFYNGTAWKNFVNRVPPIPVDYLVVAGGGGGGYGQGAGAGAGGLRTSYGSFTGGGVTAESSLELSIGIPYTVTIGLGGAGGVGYTVCCNGQDSIFSNITSTGGGAGGYYTNPLAPSNGNPGGSGGGGGGDIGVGGSPSTPTQGYTGGTAGNASSLGWLAGAGGGGAGAGGGNGVSNGSAGSNQIPGPGGNGLEVNIIGGTGNYYAGGGGGSGINGPTGSPTYTFAAGGTGGGGAGNGTSGTVNTGGGGGTGSWISSGTGGAGGSGVVILRYPSAYTIAAGGSLTSSTITVGTDKVTTFTAGSDTITFS